jgi:hypothetical protein
VLFLVGRRRAGDQDGLAVVVETQLLAVFHRGLLRLETVDLSPGNKPIPGCRRAAAGDVGGGGYGAVCGHVAPENRKSQAVFGC